MMSKHHNVSVRNEWSKLQIRCLYKHEPATSASNYMLLGNGAATMFAMTLLMIVVIASPLLAKTTYYIANGGNWSSLSSWDNGKPHSSDLAIVNNNSQVYVDGSCYAMQLTLGDTSGNRGTASLHGSTYIYSWLTTQYTVLGYYGTGYVFQYGGRNNISEQMLLGYKSSSEGFYSLQGGELFANSEIVGVESNGTIEQRGGENRVATELAVGYASGATGLYKLENGMMSSDIFGVGIFGQGTFRQTGGSSTVSTVCNLGLETGSVGSFEISAGESSVNSFRIGYDGSGSLLIQGGSVQVAGGIRLGERTGSTGSVRLNDGQLSADLEEVGYFGDGQFVQDGGTNTANRLWIRSVSGSASYEISGGTLEAGEMRVGSGSAPGTFSISDTTASVTVSDRLVLAENGQFQAVAGSTIHMTDSAFENESTTAGNLSDLANLTLTFEGGLGVVDPFEIAGEDMGAMLAGFDSNFALGTLQLGGDAGIGQVQLVDLFDNRPEWEGSEALYVENIILGIGSTLDLNGLNIYYQNFTDLGGTVSFSGGSMTQVPEPATLILLGIGGLATLLRRSYPR